MAKQKNYELTDYFQRSLTAHLPLDRFRQLQNTTVLVAGVGGGSNIAELLARKGVGRLIIADIDIFEPHNIRQRCSLVSTLGVEKVTATAARLRDVHPYLAVTSVHEGITSDNAERLVQQSDYVLDMIDLHAIKEKVALHKAARKFNKIVLTTPSVINGAVLWIFHPQGISFETFFAYEENIPLNVLASRMLKRGIPHYPPEAPETLYQAAARGERTLPLDAVGVEQAAVMTVAAIENLILGRTERVIFVPRGIQVDLSDPNYLAQIIDYTQAFPEAAC